ncbi:MAG: hypothetical protein IKQ29_01390 [Bacilli bacterium]|nr:hypothetical protein [Bacilli bacterium]
MSNPGSDLGLSVGAGIIETFNHQKIEASLSSLNTKFGEFADNCEEVITYINDNIQPEGCLYGSGAAELLKAWIPNIGSAKDFIDNFENWLTYVSLELQEINSMDEEVKSDVNATLEKLKGANDAAAVGALNLAASIANGQNKKD